jgi:hypothetical protein
LQEVGDQARKLTSSLMKHSRRMKISNFGAKFSKNYMVTTIDLPSHLRAMAVRLHIQGTPIFVTDLQRVSLCHIDHGDGFGAVGLFFSRMEFNNLVGKRFSSSEYYFHTSFFNEVFRLTGGHVGAIHNLVEIVAAHDVCFFMIPEHIA